MGLFDSCSMPFTQGIDDRSLRIRSEILSPVMVLVQPLLDSPIVESHHTIREGC